MAGRQRASGERNSCSILPFGLSTTRDLTTYDTIVTDSEAIRCGMAPTQLDGCTGEIAPSQFPAAAPYPTDEERLRFVAWIEAGMPQ